MFVTKSKILAFDFISLDHDLDEDKIRARVQHSFSRHSGLIAFYGFINYKNIGHSRLESKFNERIDLLLSKEDCDLNQAVAGSKLFGFDIPPPVCFDKQSKVGLLSTLGINCLRCIGPSIPSIWGSTIMTSPGNYLKSKYNRRNDNSCTLGDFLLFR